MTTESVHQIYGLVMIGVVYVLYLLRHTPLGFLWRGVRIFLLLLFATLLINKFKGDLKDWWNKD